MSSHRTESSLIIPMDLHIIIVREKIIMYTNLTQTTTRKNKYVYSRTPIIWNPAIRITEYPNRFIRHALNKLKGIPTEEEKEKEKREREETGEYGDYVSLREFRNILLKIPGRSEVSVEDIGECGGVRSSDLGHEILKDYELIESVREESVEEEHGLNVEVEADMGPSASQAFASLETALKWMEHQPECDHTQLLTVKRMNTVKQLTLTEMLSKQ